MQLLIQAGGVELLLFPDKHGLTALHHASGNNHAAAVRLAIKVGGKQLLLVLAAPHFTSLLPTATWSLCSSSLTRGIWSYCFSG